MMEWWNIGFKNRSAAGELISDLRGVSKKDFILLNPLFQLSNIPSFHCSLRAVGSTYEPEAIIPSGA
jgi:hypothetical protein